jgi:hypothetical protein
MVLDAGGFGLEAVIYAILAMLVGVPLVGLLIAAAASRLGGRQFGAWSVGMGIVVSVATVVVVVVLQRTISGEVTERSHDPELQRGLWGASGTLTGVTFSI